jgi:hypothetical protein
MTLTTAALAVLVSKGLSAADILEVAHALDVRKDPTAAERMRRHRAKKASEGVTRNVTVPVTHEPPNDIYSNPQIPCEANASQPPIAEKLVSEWNAGPGAKGARKATRLDASRKALLKARLRDHSEAELFRAMANLAASRFHCGENDRNWRANLGWFLEAKNFLKALEMEGGPSAANDAKPAPPEMFAALCDREILRLRSQGNEREALVWEAKKIGEERRNGSTGPPRSLGELTADIRQQVGVH